MSLTTFVPEVFRNFAPTAAVLPSWTPLARAMVAPLPLEQAEVVLEFGAGTGPMTRALLARMPRTAKLLAFEVNPRFCEFLNNTIEDRRVEVINLPAQDAHGLLRQRGIHRVDGVVSTLGLTLMPAEMPGAIYQNLMPFLDERSVLTQVQYLHRWGVGSFLRKRFGAVSHEAVWWNVPPAGFFICKRNGRELCD